jgi:hypothetical protein
VVTAGGGVAGGGAAATEAGGDTLRGGVFSTGVSSGCSGSTGGSSTTAGTGSIATRGGGSGISSGTVTDERAGLDAQEAASRPAASMVTRVAFLILNLPNP